MTIQHWRYLWKSAPQYEDVLGILEQRYTFYWDIIRNDSFVIITAAEAGIGAQVPTRFMGLARPIIVGNIAAHDGFVEFCLAWNRSYSPFSIWTDITVFDREDPSGASGQF
jgi:hypothetical protein